MPAFGSKIVFTAQRLSVFCHKYSIEIYCLFCLFGPNKELDDESENTISLFIIKLLPSHPPTRLHRHPKVFQLHVSYRLLTYIDIYKYVIQQFIDSSCTHHCTKPPANGICLWPLSYSASHPGCPRPGQIYTPSKEFPILGWGSWNCGSKFVSQLPFQCWRWALVSPNHLLLHHSHPSTFREYQTKQVYFVSSMLYMLEFFNMSV